SQLQWLKTGDERTVSRIQNCRNKAFNSVVIGFIRIDPTCMNLGLFGGLAHIRNDALAISVVLRGLVWPATYQSLIQKAFVIGVRSGRAINTGLVGGVKAAPTRKCRSPFLWHLRKHVQASANVLAALGIVS